MKKTESIGEEVEQLELSYIKCEYKYLQPLWKTGLSTKSEHTHTLGPSNSAPSYTPTGRDAYECFHQKGCTRMFREYS